VRCFISSLTYYGPEVKGVAACPLRLLVPIGLAATYRHLYLLVASQTVAELMKRSSKARATHLMSLAVLAGPIVGKGGFDGTEA